MESPQPIGGTPRIGRPPATSRPELEAVAFRLFAERGFDETSVEDVAAAAGIGRRTFFRYYPSKTDLVWGDFAAELERMRAGLAATPSEVPMMQAVRHGVVEFNRIPPDQLDQHRRRLGLILGVPTLLANSTLRFAQWRDVIAGFVAHRVGLGPGDLLPRVVGYCALGAAMAAYEEWLREPAADLSELLDEALRQLGAGFDPERPGPFSG